MSWRLRELVNMRFPFWRRRREAELDEEIQGHLRMAASERQETGEPAADAEAAARREFGNVAVVKDVTRDVWGWASLDRILQDVRYAWRVMMKRPASTFAAVLTLALAIGANVAIFSLIDRVVLHPLAAKDPDRLITLEYRARLRDLEFVSPRVLYDEYLRIRQATSPLDGLAAAGVMAGVPVSFNGDRIHASARLISAGYFAVLGLPPQIGREFGPTEDTQGAALVAMLSERSWRRRFGSDPDVIGRSISVNGQPAMITGVAAKDFAGTELGLDPADIFLPLTSASRVGPPGNYLGTPGSVINGFSVTSWVGIVGRLKPGATRAQAEAEMRSVVSDDRRRADALTVVPLADTLIPFQSRADVKRFSALLAAAVGLTLLIGCSNLASFLFSRVEERKAELALRAALGAARGRLARQLAIEAGVLAALGGVAAIAVAIAIDQALSSFELPGRIAVSALRSSLDGRVIAATIGITTLSMMLFGLAPALRGANRDLVNDLKQQGGGSRRLGPTRLLVTMQVTLSLVLVFGCGLFVRSLSKALALDLGFDRRGLVVLHAAPAVGQRDPQRSTEYADALVERVRRVPGVESAVLGDPPLSTGTMSTPRLRVDGVTADLPMQESLVGNFTGLGYFAAVGQPILSGRDFLASDDAGAPPVAVVNESAARRFWPGINPLGHRIGFDPVVKHAVVIGIVGDVTYGSLSEKGRPGVYLPRAQHHQRMLGRITLVIRTVTPRAIDSLRRAASDLDQERPLPDITTLDDRISAVLMPQRLGASLLALLGLTALALTVVGVYGLVSCVVARSMKEIAVRLALGASSDQILKATLARALLPVASGVAVGMPLAWWGGRFADRFMYGIRGSDATTAVAAACLMVAVSAIAALIPARRALRVDPMAALRAE